MASGGQRTTTTSSSGGTTGQLVRSTDEGEVRRQGQRRTQAELPGTVTSTRSPLGESEERGMATGSESRRAAGGESSAPEAAPEDTEGLYEALCRAARDGRHDLVAALLDKGAPTDLPQANGSSPGLEAKNHGMTPLLWGAERGHVEVVKALLNYKADLGAVDPFRMTALHWCSARGHNDIVSMLVAAGANLDALEQDHMTPLHLAATQGQKATVLTLLNLGADPDAEGKEKWPPLLWAAHKGNTDVVEILCQASGQAKRHMQQALHLACEMGHSSVVECLVKQGAAVNQPGPDRMSPVHRATLKGHTDVVKLLLDNGAILNPFRKDKHNLNHTPLHWAAAKGNVEVCNALLKAGQEINTVDKRNWTALHWAVEKGHSEVTALLLKNGADVNPVDKDNRAPLRFAAVQGHVSVVEELIKHGAVLDASDKTRMTALHWAAKKGRLEMVEKLLESGANPLLYDKDGNRPRDLALDSQAFDVSSALEAAEAVYAAKHPDVAADLKREAQRQVILKRSDSGDELSRQSSLQGAAPLQVQAVMPVTNGHGLSAAGPGGGKQPRDGLLESDLPPPMGCLCFRFGRN
eukprot:CAMPEP_0117675654 /NCGR_PEP_ID=MMETSP0804-20121206/15730_1 /TAXON_ID=1074897 /ORGANISM="Tetraselmis astigmatica, Strain CCMP880" /LENGTH=579 /DNA_ID=CAMNT_0005484691 /DNA_START=367 /DNA_END=2106 /DNA_ORIENTATION=+